VDVRALGTNSRDPSRRTPVHENRITETVCVA
jgi:hypothetical protein